MSQPDPPPPIPTIDLSPFTTPNGTNSTPSARHQTARALRNACHDQGFAYITNHGIPDELLDQAFATSRSLFALSHADKMKAPHPPAPTPHRGYSAPGAEKVYSADDLRTQEQERGGAGAAEREVSEQLRRIRDCKESFEVGSERNAAQPNVWLPEAVLPGFRAFATDFYWRLDGTAKCVLDALATGLELADEERRGFLAAHSGDNNQLRLLHYPAVEARMLGEGVVGRMPAHRDWSTFTLDFQDGVGGLEVRGPGVGSGFVAAGPVPGACVLNVGDMLERFTNGYFPSALHRVGLPPLHGTQPATQPRYSIPYFVAPDSDRFVEPLPSCVTPQRPSRYERIKFAEYSDWISKHSYAKAEGA